MLIRSRSFGGFDSLVDFCRKVDRTIVTRQDLLLLIKLCVFAWTDLRAASSRSPSSIYAGASEFLRAADRDPSSSRD